MASSKTLNAKNLEALGATRLAELLIETSTGNAAAKRRLRLELAGASGSADIAREVRKRLTSIARARSFVEWHQARKLAQDLQDQHRAIVELVAKADAIEALDLLWRFMGLAEPVLARVDDSNGVIGGIFRSTVSDFAALVSAAKTPPDILAQQVFEACHDNGYGQFDDLIPTLADQLGTDGLQQLKALFMAWGAEPIVKLPEAERKVIGWSTSGKIYADDIKESHRKSTIKYALQEIADALGDVDAYIAQYDAKARAAPGVASEIAQRLLKIGRTDDAWAAINVVQDPDTRWLADKWAYTRVAVLEALGKHEDAQAFRWHCYKATLDITHLRSYLKKLPDFDDMEAESRAMQLAQNVADVHEALRFFLLWPELAQANQLICTRHKEIDGNYYELLTPAADALQEKHPLAAILVRRAMIDFTLTNARSSRYKHAAKHLAECAHMATRIEDFKGLPTHETYAKQIATTHARKPGFWQYVKTK
jgi:hypothetical protein